MIVLLVEDDPTLHRNICEALQADGIHTDGLYDGALAERKLRNSSYDCVVLDVNLPGVNGFELCKRFRQQDQDTPVLLLTAFGELEDKIKGFDCGADDYLTKPFYMRELLLRIHALMKRKNAVRQSLVSGNILQVGDIYIDLKMKQVSRQGREVMLTPREFQILKFLAEKPGEIISKKELIREIWGGSFDSGTNTIEVYINFLRNKLDKPFDKQSIKTKVGFGYYISEA
jgi:two-component system, OmpR family, response regulator